MKLAKVILKPLTPFVTQLQSDTIFGSFAWGYRYVFGEKALVNKLKYFKESPFIIFSDGFIKGFLPKPYFKPTEVSADEMMIYKKYKKTKLFPKDAFFKREHKLNDRLFFEYFKQNENANFKTAKIEKEIVLKNSINRLDNRVKEGFYSIEETFLEEDIEIYFKYQNITLDEIERVFDFISKKGYGKKKSAGKGKFSFEIVENVKEKAYFEPNSNTNLFLSLSTMFYDRENLELNFGKTFTKFPKAGGDYAYSRPFKNPVIMYEAGSTFKVKNHKEFYGDAKEEVFNLENHYHSGFAIGLYFME